MRSRCFTDADVTVGRLTLSFFPELSTFSGWRLCPG